MAKTFTFLEVHLHDGLSFSASNSAPFVGSGDDEGAREAGEGEYEASTEYDETADDSGGVPAGVAALVGLVFLIGVAALARKLMGGGDDLAELDDLAETEVETSA